MVKSVIIFLFASYLTGPWCPPLGLYHTTRGTPDFSTTFPPERSIRRSSSVDSGLWSVVSRRDRHLQSWRSEAYECHIIFSVLSGPNRFDTGNVLIQII